MEKLHPGAKWLFRFKGYATMFFLMIFLSVFLSSILSFLFFIIFGSGNIMGYILFFILFSFAIIVIISEIYARMAYNRWFYEFAPTNLKIEKGIIWKKYSNIPYGRVQNVDIHRGILARMLGFSSVMIQTAGASYSPRGVGMSVEGYIPAVTFKEAEKIRDFLMKKIAKRSDSKGL